MVHSYHSIFTAYGFWLPNDPRGSWSEFVGSWELRKLGRATKTDERRSLAHDPHDIAQRRAAKSALNYPVVRFNQIQRDAIAEGIARACEESNIHVLACAIGYDHVHTVTLRHMKLTEQVIWHFRGRATQALKARGVHPLQAYAAKDVGTIPTPWAMNSWSFYVNDVTQLHNAVAYVNRHPQKEGLPEQNWGFVKGL